MGRKRVRFLRRGGESTFHQPGGLVENFGGQKHAVLWHVLTIFELFNEKVIMIIELPNCRGLLRMAYPGTCGGEESFSFSSIFFPFTLFSSHQLTEAVEKAACFARATSTTIGKYQCIPCMYQSKTIQYWRMSTRQIQLLYIHGCFSALLFHCLHVASGDAFLSIWIRHCR